MGERSSDGETPLLRHSSADTRRIADALTRLSERRTAAREARAS
jgi:hypothetical protein